MTTNRVPINRPQAVQITERALDLYESMGRLKCSCPSSKPLTQGPCAGCAAWADLHGDLHEELSLPPWLWPCVARQGPKLAGSPTMNEDIAARMAMLKEAVWQRRRAASPSLEKEGPHADPIVGEDTTTT